MKNIDKVEFAKLAKEVGEFFGGEMEKKASQLHDDILTDMFGGQLDTAVPVQGDEEEDKEAGHGEETVDQLIDTIFN